MALEEELRERRRRLGRGFGSALGGRGTSVRERKKVVKKNTGMYDEL